MREKRVKSSGEIFLDQNADTYCGKRERWQGCGEKSLGVVLRCCFLLLGKAHGKKGALYWGLDWGMKGAERRGMALGRRRAKSFLER